MNRWSYVWITWLVSFSGFAHSKALFSQPHMKDGCTAHLYDVEHTSEDSSDAMTPMLHLQPDNDQWQRRAFRLVQLMNSIWAGENERGHFQFKSTYFSVDTVDESVKRACDTVYHPRALQPALLLWQRNHDPAFTTMFSAWMDTWVDATARAERGKPAGVLPSAIHWPEGTIGGVGKNWWDPENHSTDPLYVFPSEMPLITPRLGAWKEVVLAGGLEGTQVSLTCVGHSTAVAKCKVSYCCWVHGRGWGRTPVMIDGSYSS